MLKLENENVIYDIKNFSIKSVCEIDFEDFEKYFETKQKLNF